MKLLMSVFVGLIIAGPSIARAEVSRVPMCGAPWLESADSVGTVGQCEIIQYQEFARFAAFDPRLGLGSGHPWICGTSTPRRTGRVMFKAFINRVEVAANESYEPVARTCSMSWQ